ncbi:MAG: DUF2997 domain-containing protein [Chloroflexi bacterium]|jgi:hypothetical protein|nr:DUF2997 domain-containing protein [Chloroflexota bacterium]
MELQEVELFIAKNGEVRMEVRGVAGKKCLDLTRELEAALGNEIIDRELKPEAYTEASATDHESEQEQAWEPS